MEIVFYTTGCPKCHVVRRKLDDAGIAYQTCDDIDKMLALGIQSAPVLSVDGDLKDFKNAIAWLRQYKGDNT